jgi:hypothetical protein
VHFAAQAQLPMQCPRQVERTLEAIAVDILEFRSAFRAFPV